MTNYSLRARMMILILAPTVLIGLLLSIFFVVHRYNDLQRQLEDAGASIIEPLAVSIVAIPILFARFRFMMKITDSLSPPIFILIPHQCSSAATCRFLASSLSLVTAIL